MTRRYHRVERAKLGDPTADRVRRSHERLLHEIVDRLQEDEDAARPHDGSDIEMDERSTVTEKGPHFISGGIVSVSSDYTLTEHDYLVRCNVGGTGGFTVTLPDPSPANGRIVCVMDVDGSAGSNNVTVAAASGGSVFGRNTDIATNNQALWFRMDEDGAWRLIAEG